jgi:alpha-glucosidase
MKKDSKQKPLLANIEDIPTGDRYPDAYTLYIPDQISEAGTPSEGVFVYQCHNSFALQVEVVSDEVLRFSYAPEGVFAHRHSYQLDPGFSRQAAQIEYGQTKSHQYIHTAALICQISKKDLAIEIYDRASQQLLCSDKAPVQVRRTIHKGVDKVWVQQKATASAAFFGLGDKTCDSNLRGFKLENWNTDAFGYEKDSDPLYRSIPFYYVVDAGKAYGIYFHNSYRSHFDFAKSESDTVQFWAEGGSIDYFFIYGPAPAEVARTYTQITGTPELPPLWALGFHQCRWSYYPEERVRELAQEFRQREIPCDAIYLDIDYMDGYRCFTWDLEHFSDPAQLVADLAKDHFQTVVMIDPGIRVDPDYHVYKDGLENDMFCYRASGELMRGPVWPPDCVFPDYSKPEVRAWWGQLYRELYLDQQVSGFWNDMNEPAVFKVDSATFPDHVVHDYEGKRASHKQIHNVYGLLMSRATFEGLKQLKPEKRPFVLTRATASGGQRYASVWTGDNIASWEHLRLANIQCQRLSISGYSFVGTDIGGFSQQPSGELFVRWVQLGVFHPLFRIHSMGNNVDGAAEADADAIHEAERSNRMDQEPWSFGEENTKLVKEAISFRYQLLPYLYTAFWKYANTGMPILRNLFMEAPADPQAIEREEEFFFGPDLLAMPITAPGLKSTAVYLPEGQWYDYWSGKMYKGQQLINVDVHQRHLPLFVRHGAIIPNYPVQQYTGEKVFEQITLRAYYGAYTSDLYEDAGEGYDYQSGHYSLRTFATALKDGQYSIRQQKSGPYQNSYSSFRIQVFGLPAAAVQASVDGQAVTLEEHPGFRQLVVPADFKHISFT